MASSSMGKVGDAEGGSMLGCCCCGHSADTENEVQAHELTLLPCYMYTYTYDTSPEVKYMPCRLVWDVTQASQGRKICRLGMSTEQVALWTHLKGYQNICVPLVANHTCASCSPYLSRCFTDNCVALPVLSHCSSHKPRWRDG